MEKTVELPILKERFAAATNTPAVDAYCPIDGTRLVSVVEYDFSKYICNTCGAGYVWGDNNPDSLRAQAAVYTKELIRIAGKHNEESARLDGIIRTAEQNGFF